MYEKYAMIKDISLLSHNETEKEMRISPTIRSIRMDVFSVDEEQTVYNTEMQSKKKSDLAKRSRYYQALMDTSLLEPGIPDYNRLNQTYLIVIMTFDLFGYGKYKYTFVPRCEEVTDCVLNDGAVRIFLNTRGSNESEVSKELADFLHYLENTTDSAAGMTESSRIWRIHERVRKVKASEEIGVKYMQAWEERYYDKQEAQEEGRAEGLAEGRAEGHSAAVAEMIQALIETYMEYHVSRDDAKKKIMDKLQLDEETTLQYLEKYWS
ncbi:MAG: Rpn family recombination-promoting nuclease/putative transposase [Lachnospiraceae bacterium]|nr:Rpn family recombination-promoting nuclease/putative transposase [Lachnospiraceae bacterium]